MSTYKGHNSFSKLYRLYSFQFYQNGHVQKLSSTSRMSTQLLKSGGELVRGIAI